ncbi:MAG TPA: OsmC family protein [Thermoplasmataceae archaeon]|nr:OsmC family protein [Thermoplasmataceae archaeon]
MPHRNNINLSALEKSAEKAKENNGHLDSLKEIEAVFNFQGSPMITSQVSTPLTSFTINVDEPEVLGGRGVQPTPLTYMLVGLASCFASTVAVTAAEKGIDLAKLSVRAKMSYDLGPVVVGSKFPIIRGISLDVVADKEIREVIRESEQVCPALYAIRNPIDVKIQQVKS